MYPQGACRIRKAPSSLTAAQYFTLFKPQNWRKRSVEARRSNCTVLPYLSIRQYIDDNPAGWAEDEYYYAE